MGHYQKMEEFYITNKEIIDVSDFLFSEYCYYPYLLESLRMEINVT
jgi:hypothetical protein